MNQYKKLFGNTFAMMIGNFSSKILVFLMLPLYTACLSTEEYGTVDLIFTTVNLLYPVLTLLAGEIVLRFALDKNADKTKIFSACIKLHIVGFLILLLFSPALRVVPQVYENRMIFFIYYFCGTFTNIVMQFAKGCNSVKEYAVAGFIKTFVTVSLNVLFLVFLKMGIEGYLYAYILADVIAILFLLIKLKLYKYINLFAKTDIPLLKKMLSYSIPMIPNSMCWWINNFLDRYVLLFFVNVSAIGIYSAANKIPSILIMFASIFINAWQISSVDDFGTEKNRLFFSEVYKKYSTFVICITSVGILFTKFISRILLDEKFAEAETFAQILMLAFIFHAMSTFLGTVYTSSKKTKTIFISTFLGAVFNLICNLLLVPVLGCMGAAIATAVSYMFVWVWRLIASRSIIELSINVRKDIFCYFLIISECAIILSNIKYAAILAVVPMIIVFALNYKEIRNILDLKKLKSILLKK